MLSLIIESLTISMDDGIFWAGIGFSQYPSIPPIIKTISNSLILLKFTNLFIKQLSC